MDRDEVLSGGSADKFVVGKLTTGRPEEAAHRLPRHMGIDSNRLAFIIKEGLAAIRMEFEENGSHADVKLMRSCGTSWMRWRWSKRRWLLTER
jgi:hypothetical protein